LAATTILRDIPPPQAKTLLP